MIDPEKIQTTVRESRATESGGRRYYAIMGKRIPARIIGVGEPIKATGKLNGRKVLDAAIWEVSIFCYQEDGSDARGDTCYRYLN